VNNITSQTEKFLKMSQGKDKQSGHIKNLQGSVQFVFEGIIVIHSNMPPETLFAHSVALMDRFLSIEFAPRKGPANPNLLNTLQGKISELINWGLSLETDMLQELTRADAFNMALNFDNNDVALFVNENLVIQEGFYLQTKDLIIAFGNYVMENNLNPKYDKSVIIKEITFHFDKFFNHTIENT
jgi:hypothetical protein